MTALSLVAIKAISITGLFILSIIGGILPYFLQRNLANSARYLSWCNSFAGGVFFGAGMLHLFADSQSGLALGIQTSTLKVADILVAIVAHKLLAAFSLSVSVIVSKPGITFFRLFLVVQQEMLPLQFYKALPVEPFYMYQ
eukprot:gene6781-7883_t